MDQASEYRRRAEKCRDLAAEMWLTVYRTHFLEIAEHWEELAVEEELEALTRAPANDPGPQRQAEDGQDKRRITDVFGMDTSTALPGVPAPPEAGRTFP
jgi:hypothetical protein